MNSQNNAIPRPGRRNAQTALRLRLAGRAVETVVGVWSVSHSQTANLSHAEHADKRFTARSPHKTCCSTRNTIMRNCTAMENKQALAEHPFDWWGCGVCGEFHNAQRLQATMQLSTMQNQTLDNLSRARRNTGSLTQATPRAWLVRVKELALPYGSS